MDDLLFSYADPATSPMRRRVIRMIEVATGQRELKALYLDNQRNPVPSESFWHAAVRRLKLDVRYDAAALERMPRQGPVVVVANHPYGVLDGIVISWLIEKVRTDFLVLTNAVLLRAPEVRDFVLPVDFSETEEARQINLRSRAAARSHLDRGGCVVVFPAGGVSTAPDRLGRKPAVDAPWQPFTAQLIQRSKATVVPICFSGQNSRLFQIASHLSLTLRLSLIFREVRNRMGTVLPVAIGDPIAFEVLAPIKDRAALVQELRNRTYGLANLPSGAVVPRSWKRSKSGPLGYIGRPGAGDDEGVPKRAAAVLQAWDEASRPHAKRPGWIRRRVTPGQPRPR
ncbi:MAG: lysophospholipid acyltransferase family protein [Methylobacteriaceae bacterium]|nr:lysophospholipid acyltransferase family protein [Methylobacteriaceae bacterium]